MEQALAGIFHGLGWLLLALAALGSLYTLVSALVLHRFFAGSAPPGRHDVPVTILKPLHGAEARLEDNLTTFLAQDYAGPVEMVCGVGDREDSAVAIVDRLGAPVRLIVDPARHGANAKVSNLINIARNATLAPVVVISDSDIAVAPDYLAHIVDALETPGVGAVSCLYRGRGDAGFWSQLAAGWPSYQFLPGAVFALATGIATPSMGSTIALRRETLERIGGFERFADILADDDAIGRAVEALGLRIAVPPMLVVHASDERSFGAVWRHELRWAVTVRDITPAGYAGSVIGLPFPGALLGAALTGAGVPALLVIATALASRLILARAVDRASGERAMPLWLLPLRDLLSYVVFFASFFVRSVDWRGSRLTMQKHGRIAA
ncbi:MAG TPA: bacteriohopanetetrol glucosamine biosynthesis glycosyltransferase HpnI [Sphingomonas sp.]|nr:bacteriohopanetetrol glucosamine biosynthesis glycosyltransferase HpnI [Sphingomonas sp.]